jgi:exopolyphosphatase / guanosine-5'-triphosphate,3'-diphosphate pyrophosphatase
MPPLANQRANARTHARRTAPQLAGRVPVPDLIYGALDLGTNNCRLLVAVPQRTGFKVLDAFSRVVRLGEGLAQTGMLSDAAQDRTVAALAICAEKLKRRSVHIVRNVATEACRQASNCQQFVERVHAETGLHLDVISPSEEARLAVLGCQTLFDPTAERVLVFDIGGGSTELILVRHKKHQLPDIIDWVSVPWGVVSLSEAHGEIHVPAENYGQMRARIYHPVREFAVRNGLDDPALLAGVQVLGTSGTVTTLTSLHLGLQTYDRRQVDGATVAGPALRDLSGRLALMSYEERVKQGSIGEDRAELIVAGCAILQAILEALPAQLVRVADRGIREGILRVLMSRDGHRTL